MDSFSLQSKENFKFIKERVMSYQRVPESFMNGIFIKPYSFSDPQNPKHGQYVNMQLKNDLYYSALNQITNIQFKTWGNQDEWIQVEQIIPCKGEDPRKFWIAEMYKRRKGRIISQRQKDYVETLSCEDWKVVLHRKDSIEESIYRVKTQQTKTDIFRAQIIPPTFLKQLKDLIVN